MSNCKARLMKPTGLEFHDVAYEIDYEIWNFIKHELKRKTKEQEGNLPVRYWQTHAVPLHQECWALVGSISKAMSVYPSDLEKLKRQNGHFQDALEHNETLLQLIRLINNEIPEIGINKLDKAMELIVRESRLLKGVISKNEVKQNRTS